jgi:hypothetical protein
MGIILNLAALVILGLLVFGVVKEKPKTTVLLGLLLGAIFGAGQNIVCDTKPGNVKGSGDWVCPGGTH